MAEEEQNVDSLASTDTEVNVTRSELLMNQIRKLSDDCKRMETALENNWSPASGFTVADIVSGKGDVIDNLAAQLDSKLPHKSLFSCDDADDEAKDVISKEEDDVEATVRFLTKVVAEEEVTNAKLEKKILMLKALNEAKDAEAKQKKRTRAVEQLELATKILDYYSSKLNVLIDDAFGEHKDDARAICNAAVKAHFTDNKYIKVTGKNFKVPAALALCRSRILIRHHVNKKEYKLNVE